MKSLDLEKLIPARDAAEQLRTTPANLANWRSARKGPPYYRLGGRVYYDPADLSAWVASQRVETQGATEGAA